MPQRSNSARYMWGDRNPLNKSQNLILPLTGPHVATIRWTYTVPAGKKAQVHGAQTSMRIESVAAPASVRENIILLNDGAISPYLIHVQLNADKNVVGNSDHANVGLAFSLLAGHALQCITADGSTGGTVSYLAGAVIIEYDA